MLKSKITAARVVSVPFRALIKIYDNTCKKSLRPKCSKVIFVNIEICSACYTILLLLNRYLLGVEMKLGHARRTRFWYLLGVHLWLTHNASVNSSGTHPPPLPGTTPWALAFFFCLVGWQIPGGETLELSNTPRWGQKKMANAPSSVNTATFFIDCTVE